MESTFSAQFLSDPQSDGSVRIKYRAKAYQGPNFGAVLTLGAFGSLLYFLFMWVLHGVYPIVSFLMLVLYAAFAYKLFSGNEKAIVVIPREGIKWSSHQLPFSDVTDFGVMRLQTHAHGHLIVSGYVYAESRGREIQITEHVPFALASAIRDEIQKLSESL